MEISFCVNVFEPPQIWIRNLGSLWWQSYGGSGTVVNVVSVTFLLLYSSSAVCPDFQGIFQYMAISGNENLLNCIQNCAKIGPKLCQILNLPSKNCQRLVRFCQSGQFWPNLVSLLLILLWEVKGNKNCFAIILLFCFLGSASSSPAAATRDSWKVIKIWSWSSFIATKFSISFFDVPISYNTYYYTYCTYCYTYNAYYYT